jgi:cytochrome P450
MNIIINLYTGQCMRRGGVGAARQGVTATAVADADRLHRRRHQVTGTQSLAQPSDFDWTSHDVSACPYPFYESLHREQPVFRYAGTTLYGSNVFLVSRWEDIAYVTRHPDQFIQFLGDSGPDYTEVFAGCPFPNAPKGAHSPYPTFYTDGSDHRTKRGWALKIVEREQLRRASEIIRRQTHELLDKLLPHGGFEFRAAFAAILPPRIIAEIVGTSPDGISEWNPAGVDREAGRRSAWQYVEREVLARYRNPAGDLMSEIIRAQVEMDGGLDLNFQVSFWTNILSAGSVTSVQMLANLMQLLLLNPEVMARVRSDRAALGRAVEESLRLESPIQVLPRLATADSVVGGVPIPAGSVLVLLYGAGNRDSDKFADPSRFDIDRGHLQRDSLAFGLGKHRCAGAPLARLEGVEILGIIFERADEITIDLERSDLTKVIGPARVDFGPKALYVKLLRR